MSTDRPGFWLFIAVLVLAAVGIASIRHEQMGVPLLPGQERVLWLVEARIDFVASGGPVRVNLDLPESGSGYRLRTERAASPAYGFALQERDGDRRGLWTRREARGLQTLFYAAEFVPQSDPAPMPVKGEPEPTAAFLEEPAATAADRVLAIARERSSDARSLAQQLVQILDDSPEEQNVALLESQGPSRAELVVLLLNRAGIAARLSLGLELEDARRRRPLIPVVELPLDGHWIPFDAHEGERGTPEGLLLWHRGGSSVLDVEGGENSRLGFSILRQTVPALEFADDEAGRHPLGWFGVSALPVEEQSMFRLLFLLPLGALVVVFMRVVIGVRTSGTFMPVLIALAFLQTSLGLGLASFVLLVAVGLVLRGYLSSLNLLLPARIAALIVIVTMLIVMLSLAGHRVGVGTGMTITFFPTVIIAWTIERMSILWEEEGSREVLIQGSGSLLVAVLAYLLMERGLVQHLSFNFPELNLLVLAAILLVGQYTGYRLSELFRFRFMPGDDR